MAKIEKPAAIQIAPPKQKVPTGNSKSSITPAITSKPAPADVKPIQFKISASMHLELKLYAVEQGMSMTDLFLKMYKEYRAKHG